MPKDPMYLPMQVGSAIEKNSDGTPMELGYARDDEGDNISEKNPLFCELTGLYWAWKHLDSDYIGLVHYRRHFGGRGIGASAFRRILTYEDLQPMLNTTRVFVPTRRRYWIESLYSHYEHTHYAEHLYITRALLEQKDPSCVPTFDKVLSRTSGYMFNMMIMDRELLDAYCTWLFDILFDLEKKVDIRNLSFFQERYCGRIGELIFNVWLEHQLETGVIRKNEVRELPYIYMEKIDWWKKGRDFLLAKFFHKRYER